MISVIVPIYNVEKYLRECVDSIINQTYRDLEIILVDDGSPDGCGRICDEYAQKDHRIRVVHKKNGGLSDARNAGIEIAMGEYYVFVDSDDVIHPQMTEYLLKTLCTHDADMAICRFEELEEDGSPSFASIKCDELGKCVEKESIMEQLEKQNLITVVAWNKIYRASLFQEIRYPKGYIHEDEFVIHKLLHLCNRIVYTEQKLYYYRKRSSSIMGKINEKNIKDIFCAYEDRILFLKKNNYEGILTGTKLQMLHLIIKYQPILKKQQDGEEMQDYCKWKFQELFEDVHVKAALSAKQNKDYTVFNKSPEKYFFREKMKFQKSVIKESIKNFVRKLQEHIR